MSGIVFFNDLNDEVVREKVMLLLLLLFFIFLLFVIRSFFKNVGMEKF